VKEIPENVKPDGSLEKPFKSAHEALQYFETKEKPKLSDVYFRERSNTQDQ